MCLANKSVIVSRLSWLLLVYLTCTVSSQCEHGLEAACVWLHEPTSALRWQRKGTLREQWVELSGCQKPQCGIGEISSPWMPAREGAVDVRLEYKLYGTSKVYLRLNLKLDDSPAPRQLFSKAANYAHGYPDQWAEHALTIPPTHTSYKLSIKAYIPYAGAMVAVKGIRLDDSVVITSTRSSSTTSTSTATQSAMVRPQPRTTSTPPAKPDEDEGERTWDNSFPDDDEEEDERRLEALEVENFISEEDLLRGYTTVVEPRICGR